MASYLYKLIISKCASNYPNTSNIIMPSSSSSSSSSRYKNTRRSPERPKKEMSSPSGSKIFVTNLDGAESPSKLNQKLKELFSTECKVLSVDTKCSFDHSYCFSFVEIEEADKVDQVIAALNGKLIDGKKIKVEKQHSSSRPRGPSAGGNCYHCNKPGHIARFCTGKRSRSSTRVKEDKARGKRARGKSGR